MKHRIFISFCLLTTCAGIQADNKEVVMCSDTKDTTPGSRHYLFKPIVTYDDNKVVIKTQEGNKPAYVVIKNSQGEVIYEGVQALSPFGNVINVPDGINGDKDSIEIYYDEECAYGYFQ